MVSDGRDRTLIAMAVSSYAADGYDLLPKAQEELERVERLLLARGFRSVFNLRQKSLQLLRRLVRVPDFVMCQKSCRHPSLSPSR